jgi:hypothetical protein
MNKIATAAFGLCFALALFAAAHSQNGGNPTGGGGGGTITAASTPTSGCTDTSFIWSSSSVVACGGELKVFSGVVGTDSSHSFQTPTGRGFIANASNGRMSFISNSNGNNFFGIGAVGNDGACLGYNASGIGSTIACVLSWSDGTGSGVGLATHINYNGASPVVSACGTGSPAIDANATDSSGTVTIGTVATSCTITFAAPYTTFVHCTISSQTTVSGLAYSYTISAITLSASVLGGDKIDYKCDGV